MYDIISVDQSLKPLRSVALLGYDMSGESSFKIDQYFDIERPEGFVELGVGICFVLFGREGESKCYWDPGEARSRLV